MTSLSSYVVCIEVMAVKLEQILL